jgi:hypothetical protein
LVFDVRGTGHREGQNKLLHYDPKATVVLWNAWHGAFAFSILTLGSGSGYRKAPQFLRGLSGMDAKALFLSPRSNGMPVACRITIGDDPGMFDRNFTP